MQAVAVVVVQLAAQEVLAVVVLVVPQVLQPEQQTQAVAAVV
jgi:hypothetical protein